MYMYGEKLGAGPAEREWLKSLVDVIVSVYPPAGTVPWRLNPRLSRALGRCVADGAGIPASIEINENYLCLCYRMEVLGLLTVAGIRGDLMGTLVHEAAHLEHFDHGPGFRLAERRLGKLVRAKMANPEAAEVLAAARMSAAGKPASPRQGELDFCGSP